MFQEFVTKIMKQDQQAKFIPWFNENVSDLPEIDTSNIPYKVIKGKVCPKDYLGAYNPSKGRIYGRVKVQTQYAFKELKDKLVDWLHYGLHWIKEDYIQARRVSNIGLLAGTHNVVVLVHTRQALEQAVMSEIHAT